MSDSGLAVIVIVAMATIDMLVTVAILMLCKRSIGTHLNKHRS